MDATAASKPHFRILEDIARDLSGEVNFPTCLDAAIMVRNTLKDPYASLDKVVQAVGVEPLIASKLLRIANSAALNPGGLPVTDLRVAIGRLGFEAVRATALAVAMDQLLKSRNLAAFDSLSRRTWDHSLQLAAISRVLARHIGKVNPEEAMMAGMVCYIGVFYLLYRAAEYPEYRNDAEAAVELVGGWCESIGESLLYVLGMPERIIEAIRGRSRPHNPAHPFTLRDVLYFADILADGKLEWMQPSEADPQTIAADRERFADLMADAQDDLRELRAALDA